MYGSFTFVIIRKPSLYFFKGFSVYYLWIDIIIYNIMNFI